ncbi:MAG: glycosyltransferase [Anaerolineae bacterium]|nr:glycosyltransferase [Anaerolineae bacterium]
MMTFPDILILVAQTIYLLATLGLGVIGLNALVLSILYAAYQNRRSAEPAPLPDDHLPSVLVQLPIYNESFVVERLIRAAAALDFPRARLEIQVLDDSTDETVQKTAVAVEKARMGGLNIRHIRRGTREGFKAGALAYGLAQSVAEIIVIFDADFLPDPGFLRRIVPYFTADTRLGLLQTRWAHLNDDFNSLTMAQSIALDNHFVVEQTARQRSGLLMNFAGTAGAWRRTCIEQSGGWQGDTLSEDIDLSYRAQLMGWHCLYLPEVSVRAEIPPLVMGFKRQQARWATGTVQCFRKLGLPVLRSGLTPWQKAQAMIHLGGYFIHPLMLLVLLLTLPLLLIGALRDFSLTGVGFAMIGPPVQAIIAQSYLYPDWYRRLVNFPMLMLMGVGIAVNNTEAVARGLSSVAQPFERTPKFFPRTGSGWIGSAYTLPADRRMWLELALAFYALVTAGFGLERGYPGLATFMLLYAGGFLYIAGGSLLQTWQAQAQRGLRRFQAVPGRQR